MALTLKEIFCEISTIEEILTFELHNDITDVVIVHEELLCEAEAYDAWDKSNFVETLLNDANGFHATWTPE